MRPFAIESCGMVTGVGFTAPASCAAIRAAVEGFVETRFMFDGDWLIGSPVPFETPYRGREKLLQMIVPAIREALTSAPVHDPRSVPLMLCVSEPERPGSFLGPADAFLRALQERLGWPLHSESRVFTAGSIGGVHAIQHADQLLQRDETTNQIVLASVDSLLTAETLNHYHAHGRLLTAQHSDGFIPGEAGCAVVLGRFHEETTATLAITGVGFGEEPAMLGSGEPLRAEGVVAATRQAMGDAGVGFEMLAYRLTDNSGEHYGFKEAATAALRMVRPVKPEFDLVHPADCIGNVGAAMVPALIAVAHTAERKGYAPGRQMGDGVLCHLSADTSARAAFVLRTLSALRNVERGAA